jgi:hypothetical protein
MSTKLSMHMTVEGVAIPFIAEFYFEEPDPGTGFSGGWFLWEAELDLSHVQRMEKPKLSRMLWDRGSFEAMFGRTALQVAEEGACDHYMGLREDAEEAKEEVFAR